MTNNYQTISTNLLRTVTVNNANQLGIADHNDGSQ